MTAGMADRPAEEETLGEFLDAASSAPSALLVDGEAGIGKTTILDDVGRETDARGWPLAWGRCVEAGMAPALWPWVEALRSLARASSPESHAASPAARSRRPALSEVSECAAARSLADAATAWAPRVAARPATASSSVATDSSGPSVAALRCQARRSASPGGSVPATRACRRRRSAAGAAA